MMRTVADACHCFPTGQLYPGIAHLMRSPSIGIAEELDAASSWFDLAVAMIDTETTGRIAHEDRIVEVAVVIGKRGEVISRDTWLINPQCPIPVESSKVHGIYDDDVKDKPTFEDVAPEIIKRLQGVIPAAYNASFDRGFLLAEVKRCLRKDLPDVPATRDRVVWLDPLVWARHLFAQEKSRTLSAMAQLLGVQLEKAHRASDDAEAALMVMYAMANHEQIPKSYGSLIQLQASHARAQDEARALWRYR